MIEKNKRTIYVELLEEGTTCWRPVEAADLGVGFTGLLEKSLTMRFGHSRQMTSLKCKMKMFRYDKQGLIAYEKASQ